ncbi:9270_t:CDS:2 [Gigaspora margarita]|uniref:9270_t:CDS:1 n=1 Tax=Gigaspora margarita TaxID=4874 RepID=A0ABN7WCA6_GIGMA|nr:9270_t:CDS:2 [Gigaspora margarita]
MALYCDVLQNDFFAKWDIKDLINKYRNTINVLCSQNFEPLQLVIAVALLKELVNYLWSSLESFQNMETKPVMFNNKIEGIDKAIEDINLAMKHPSPLIHSLKLYFLRDLYVKGLSLHGIKAYRCYDQYIEAENAFTPLYKRKLNMTEEYAIKWLHNQLPAMKFGQFYIDKLLALLDNTNQLYSISTETNQTELLIKLVIIHTIALYSCIAAVGSLLATYLQTLRTCNNTYILASCVDNDFLLELIDALRNFTQHYQYGYKYIVGECGGTMEETNCSRCANRIGGLNHIANLGNRHLDTQVINRSVETITQLGYVYESVESRKYINYHLHDLIPVFYCILHLFVHILIAADSDADRQEFFKPLVYCQRHIENDWQILTCLFDCDDEILAFALYSILHSIFKNPNEALIRLDTIEKRQAWENEFAQHSQHTLESEINETLDIDKRYQRDFCPQIWQQIGKTSFENLQAYCIGYSNFSTEFPFLSLFFEYQEQLILVKNLVPIVKFLKILSSMLSYRLKRSDAYNFTFERFLNNSKSSENLEAFENFAEA